MKKICHVIIGCFYKEGYGYQENILPSKHQQLGYEVSIVTQNVEGHPGPCEYINDRGVKVFVLAPNESLLARMKGFRAFVPKTKGLYQKLCDLAPDILFVHNINALDHRDVVRYKCHHKTVRLFIDNHCDLYNTPHTNSIKTKVVSLFGMKRVIRQMAQQSECVWGVTPWRVAYARKVFGIPAEKVNLLVMGGDENLIHLEKRDIIRKDVRERYGISQDAFLIVSGGKIDFAKNFHMLVDAVRQLNGVSLLLFGKPDDTMKPLINSLHDERIFFIGWIPSDDCYDLFLASDLAVFPGTHSVLWEQACASGIPAIFKDWDGGFNHVDVGGNCTLLKEISVESIRDAILSIQKTPGRYQTMKEIAMTRGTKEFSYINIARRSILAPVS